MTLKVLHVGNIANNAFCAAYVDRQNGIDSFVVNPHLHDAIATPIWEFKNSDGIPKNLNTWYASGNWKQILKKWNGNRFIEDVPDTGREFNLASKKFFIKRLFKRKLNSRFRGYLSNEINYRIRTRFQPNLYSFFESFNVIIFYGPYTSLIKYAPVHKTKIAFEHGTLENFCKGPYKYCRDSLEGYLNADYLLLTNQGSLRAISNLGLQKAKTLNSPHPTVDFDLQYFRTLRDKFLEIKGPTPFILAPARHSLSSNIEVGKGNELVFRAFASLVRKYSKLKIVCIANGDDVISSMRLVTELGIGHAVEWLPIQTRYKLKMLMTESLCVIDQMNSESYGTITTDALLLGVPVLTAHDCDLDQSFFGECAPVVPCSSSLDISNAVEDLITKPAMLLKINSDSKTWSDLYLTSKQAFRMRERLYLAALN